VCEEAPEPANITTHILGADKHTKSEQAADDLIPDTSLEYPANYGWKERPWDHGNVMEIFMHSGPARIGGNFARFRRKEER